ncbi:50S ribosomal protein L10 [Candidatus Daviesbacteria bacterium RIFCSPHIGHO2_01_FULL_44_29]|uniref:Large ribosomal subunit protein uL10 n=1 Tax=Candidatus Daviesbacteria bacterium RIFCSPHIGHO2_02_FULL_43_12 TaxID=1797776 RepID=A0A1F5KIR4_9BACT|nr:MAG: 50S ribosomal protein L10 [Candidatus Daviesbacteria bacterium RIFCSPHIGHO2_01_FULL_44_29]OGE40354.1 MAG: 50S ribosomal protein L10 [Candidatus Daviesbacteria bacterium RIFCSPHIGHO2_12_FULL_47_45]OGE40710.1 MAG: 50S ribosomal protein L10 [Candidatus Daviesbacteria bacterium RIFCSPHIGHO2_02_FULL_43_12]OGE69793.1 MAG: 50S ribosomal protein L10 [Candidatus Daviesbacteria bacterium RIFCSPLOWO2_01_FULL_43_15]
MPKTRAQKEDTVKTLTDQLSRAKSVVFANYQGLTMSQLSVLRSELRTQNATFNITKNNLLKIALKGAHLPETDAGSITGPIATLLTFEDEITPIKALTKAIKDNGIGEIKGGLLDGEFMTASKVVQLSTLPSKDQLRAQVVGALGSPLYGIVGVLQANLRNLVYALDQIRISRGGE